MCLMFSQKVIIYLQYAKTLPKSPLHYTLECMSLTSSKQSGEIPAHNADGHFLWICNALAFDPRKKYGGGVLVKFKCSGRTINCLAG